MRGPHPPSHYTRQGQPPAADLPCVKGFPPDPIGIGRHGPVSRHTLRPHGIWPRSASRGRSSGCATWQVPVPHQLVGGQHVVVGRPVGGGFQDRRGTADPSDDSACRAAYSASIHPGASHIVVAESHYVTSIPIFGYMLQKCRLATHRQRRPHYRRCACRPACRCGGHPGR